MTKRIDELERLNQLRRSGTLNDEEYQQQKAKLLDDDAGGVKFGHPRHWSFQLMLLVVLIFCAFVIRPLIDHDDDQGAGAGTTGWVVSQAKDPMTDRVTTTASTTLDGTIADIRFAISCSDAGSLEYDASSYDDDGNPVAMRTEINGNLDPAVPLEVRADQKPAVSVPTIDPRYSNEVVIQSEPVPSTVSESRLADDGALTLVDGLSLAQRLTFAFHLEHGDETIAIDQSDPALSGVLGPCIRQRKAQFQQALAAWHREIGS